ncbi:substrate-binding domain-containing protein [Propionibacterium sp.]|uniref:substrate-binding domain-containing protein n=1 Tax=Propionibacterium sp. TaxID=1977903 RepID=UPI0039EAAB64
MRNDDGLSVDEVAEILQVSRNTVYALKNKGTLNSYTVGRKLRFTYADVQAYISSSKKVHVPETTSPSNRGMDRFVICGQDIILDVLSNYVAQAGIDSLRAYIGSYDALTALYKDSVQVASAHLWDSASDEYNVPYVKRLLPAVPTVVINLTYRNQGLYVARGNPKHLQAWSDLLNPGVTMVNREKGAGSRVLLDEHLELLGADPHEIKGYATEVQSHIAVASAVARGRADVAVGSEKIARQVEGVDFVPLQRERYDLVVKQENFDTRPVQVMMGILESGLLREEFAGLGGYDTSEMGRIVAIG